MSENKPAHRRIFQLLQRHDLQQDEKGRLCHSNAIAMPSACHTNGINIGIGIGLGCIKNKEEGSVRGDTISNSLPAELDDFKFLQAWDEWIEYRKERRLAPYKPTGLRAQRTRLSGWASTHGLDAVIDCIRSSIANNYQGLFEPKPPDGRNHRPDPTKTIYDETALDL